MSTMLITRHELEKKIIEGCFGHIDFYAYCNTPWHSLGIQSFLNELAKCAQDIKGIIFIANQPGEKHIVTENDFRLDKNISVTYHKNIDSFRGDKKSLFRKLITSKNSIKENRNPFLILRPFRPDYKFGAEYQIETGNKCELICIDEGVGTYKTDKEIFSEKIKGSIRDAALYFANTVLNRYLARKYKLSVRYYTLFQNAGDGTLQLNSDVARAYKQTISHIELSDESLETTPYVMLLTQPFEIEQDKACAKEINAMFDQVRVALLAAGIVTVIKPHPRESADIIESYRNRGFKVFAADKPIETYLEALSSKPLAVVGTVSTGLITAKVLNDIPAISVVKLIDSKLNKNYVKTAQRFGKRYGTYVAFPENLNAFIKGISE